MEIQRLLLFGSLAVVLMLIWQSWGDFQQQRLDAQPSVTALPPGQEAVPSAPEIDSELPAAPTEAGLSNSPVDLDDASPPTDQQQLINITTDLLHAQIDPHGGDLVRVELLKHPVNVDTPEQPFVLMSRDQTDLFVAQSGLVGPSGRAYPNHNIDYTAERGDYRLQGDEALSVALRWTAPDGVIYDKIFHFKRDSYRIDLEFRVNNQSDAAWRGFIYGQLKQTERTQPGSQGFLGRLPSYNGAAIYTAEQKYDKIDYGEIRESDLDLATEAGWVAMLQHYFVSAWLPTGSASYQLYTGINTATANPQYRVGYKAAQPVNIEPGQRDVIRTALFVGPKEQSRLDQQNVEGLKLTVDYGWLTPVADPLFWLLNHIHKLVQNWGWAIILLTMLVKLIFLPLSAASYRSMAKMKKLQPRLQTLKERYGADKQKFQQEMMKLYKAEKVNPAGGCLPIVVQIPVFIALYWVLLESVELRQAAFILWLNDLSLPDPYFVLPVIMGLSMLAQQWLNPAPMDPIQKKVMMAMPIVFTVFFLWFPAGLVLYWVVNNLLSIAQQYYISRKYQAA